MPLHGATGRSDRGVIKHDTKALVQVRKEGLSHSLNTFKRGLEIFARALANKGVKLVFRGNDCYTTGTTIVVPEIAALSREGMTLEEVTAAQDLLETIRGRVVHEVGHVLYTDFAACEDAVRREKGPLVKQIWNALEDAFVERRMVEDYAGTGVILDNMNEWHCRALMDEISGGKVSPLAQVVLGTTIVAKYGTDHWFYRDLPENTRKVLDRLGAEINRTRTVTNSWEVLALATDLLDKIEKLTSPPPPKPPKPAKGQQKKSGAGSEKEDGDDADEGEEGQRGLGGDPDEVDEDAGEDDAVGDDPSDADDDGESSGDEGDEADSDDEEEPAADDADAGEEDGDGDSDADGSKGASSGDPDDDADDDDSEGKSGSGGDADDESDSSLGAGKHSEGDDFSEDDGLADDEAREELKKALEEHAEAAKDLEKSDTASTISKAMGSVTATGIPSDRYLIYTTEYDKVIVPTTTDKGRVAYAEMCKSLRDPVAVGKRQLANLLKARTLSHTAHDLEEGDLDRTKLYRLATRGDARIFKETTDRSSLKGVSAVLMINLSGSMQLTTSDRLAYPGMLRNDGEKMRLELAIEAAMIFGECLSSIGVPFEVLGHSTTHIEGHKTWAACPASLRKLYTRWGGTIIEEYKTFDESWKAVAPRIMEAKVCHNTHDAEAVKLASNRLLARKDVTRRIVFMLDDGQPFPNVWRPDLLYIRDDPDFYEKSEVIAKHAEALRRSVLDSEAAGIEVIGIGMGDDSVSKFYTNHLVVHNTKEFSKLFIEKLKTILLLKKR